MTTKCNICNSLEIIKIYTFSDRNITSICSEKNQSSNVYFCSVCTHVMTDPLEDIENFYAEAYNINAGSEEEDQLLRIESGKKVYRYDYQAETFIKKLNVDKSSSIKVMDFGAAKATTLKKIVEQCPLITPLVYDVSTNYKHFWDKFVKKEGQFISKLPDDLKKTVDVVSSFFMLEHVADPVSILKTQYSLLKEGGIVYYVIPNLYKNTADLMVLDHVNHFSKCSIAFMMEKIGFIEVNIDEEVNDGWFVVTGKKGGNLKLTKRQLEIPTREESSRLFSEAKQIAEYWISAHANIKNFKTTKKFAIYGAGFYGSYIFLNLPDSQKPSLFIDQNPFLQNKKVHGIEVVSPDNLPLDVDLVLVGINPQVAHEAIQSICSWENPDLKFLYLFSE